MAGVRKIRWKEEGKPAEPLGPIPVVGFHCLRSLLHQSSQSAPKPLPREEGSTSAVSPHRIRTIHRPKEEWADLQGQAAVGAVGSELHLSALFGVVSLELHFSSLHRSRVLRAVGDEKEEGPDEKCEPLPPPVDARIRIDLSKSIFDNQLRDHLILV